MVSKSNSYCKNEYQCLGVLVITLFLVLELYEIDICFLGFFWDNRVFFHFLSYLTTKLLIG